MLRLLNHQIKANLIFKVSRLSEAELVKTFAQLLGTERQPGPAQVPCFFPTHKNQNNESQEPQRGEISSLFSPKGEL